MKPAVSFSLIRCLGTLNSVTPLTESCTTCVPSFEERYAVVAVMVGSPTPRPARCTGRKKEFNLRYYLGRVLEEMLTNGITQCLKI